MHAFNEAETDQNAGLRFCAARLLMKLAPRGSGRVPTPSDSHSNNAVGAQSVLAPGGVRDQSGMLRVAACRWLANDCFQDASAAESALQSGALHASTHHRAIDPRAPTLRDWAMLVTRNACIASSTT